MNKDEAFMKHLMETFRIEADEHLKAMSLLLIALEKADNPLDEKENIETVFREAHSLKGAARAVNLKEIEGLCQSLESIFSQMKRRTLTVSTGIFDLLLEVVDFLAQRILSIEHEVTQENKDTETALLSRMEQVKSTGKQGSVEPTEQAESVEIEETIPPEKTVKKETEPVVDKVIDEIIPVQIPSTSTIHKEAGVSVPESGTMRVSYSKLSSVLLQSEELLSVKMSASQRAKEIKELAATYPPWKKEWSKVLPAIQDLRSTVQEKSGPATGVCDPAQIRSLKKVLEFVEWNCDFIKNSESSIRTLRKLTARDSLVLDGMVDTLLEDMKKVTMFPFSSLLELIPKVVRDLSKDSGRKVSLAINGSEIEIDRRILDELRDPLTHIIRNCIDHGIEKPDERKQKGKPATGNITIEVFPRDHKVEMIITDDGAGISAEKIRMVMQKTGTLSSEKIRSLSDRELISYVFHSGISTSPIITELSGRGLGLAIVREKVEKLGGSITLETQPDAGTKFHIVLPLTIATFRGILISAGDQDFVLPTMYVERVMRIKTEDLKTVENRETILINECPVSMARLASVLGIKAAEQLRDGYLHVVVLAVTGIRIAFLIDRVHHEQEVLFKSLGPQLTRARNIAGATVMGTGRAVPILNVPDLLKSAVQYSGTPILSSSIRSAVRIEAKVPSVLVAEDSITTRTLLKNILETAGYSVQTAIDGLDALMKLKSGHYDIVLSDVDMPRMNGFDLTDKIRKDPTTRNLPVILITALASREDQERGIDAGANAYIVKSMFDQSNLLNVMERLIPQEDEQ